MLSVPLHSTEPSADELALIALAFSPSLADDSLGSLLKFLNRLTPYRFTGVYRFQAGWVMSVAVWDRAIPAMAIGANVDLKESCCWSTGLGKSCYAIEDAPSHPRLGGHAAREDVRSYVAVLLRDTRRALWGTLCHFDFQPRAVARETLTHLETFRPLVEEMLVRDEAAMEGARLRAI